MKCILLIVLPLLCLHSKAQNLTGRTQPTSLTIYSTTDSNFLFIDSAITITYQADSATIFYVDTIYKPDTVSRKEVTEVSWIMASLKNNAVVLFHADKIIRTYRELANVWLGQIFDEHLEIIGMPKYLIKDFGGIISCQTKSGERIDYNFICKNRKGLPTGNLKLR